MVGKIRSKINGNGDPVALTVFGLVLAVIGILNTLNL